MKIDFELEFDDYILKRGYEYYLDNKVINVEIEDDIVAAEVLGNENYDVSIEIDNGLFIDGECSCPYYDSGKYCKHIAALLYYLNEKKHTQEKNDIENIVNNANDKKIRSFLYSALMNDSSLLNRFRVEFSDFFPKLSKEEYKRKIYKAISNCEDKYGFIDYNNTYKYHHAMFEYTNEAEKLLNDKDYNTAFIIATIILDSIPNTDIDDSDGSTGMIADSCIKIIHNILDKVTDKKNIILKDILTYIINEIKTAHLYNYGIDIKELLKYFIDNNLYLNDIETSLETALTISKDKSYFYSRKYYIEYLIQIYKLNNKEDKIISLLEEFSFDRNICIMYVDELIKQNKIDTAIKVLNDKLDIENRESRFYADKLSKILLDNNKIDKYKNILYDIYFKYDKYDFVTYIKIKKLYSNNEWNIEKEKIISTMKKDKYIDRNLNKIYIEENMFDELFENIKDKHMNYIIEYEKYLLPKYKKEILDIYMESCLLDADNAKNRKAYRDVAFNVNHIIKIDDNIEISKYLLKEISNKHFRSRFAMLDEFNSVIKNLNDYIK